MLGADNGEVAPIPRMRGPRTAMSEVELLDRIRVRTWQPHRFRVRGIGRSKFACRPNACSA